MKWIRLTPLEAEVILDALYEVDRVAEDTEEAITIMEAAMCNPVEEELP